MHILLILVPGAAVTQLSELFATLVFAGEPFVVLAVPAVLVSMIISIV